MKTLLITGGAGFVGSSLAINFKRKYPSNKVICLDNLKRRGSELNIQRLREFGIEFIHGDVRNQEDLNDFHDVDTIIECSAEPSVLSGVNSSPNYLLNTNLAGTINCLNLAVRLKSNFIFLSTSRIYPINQIDQINYIEDDDRFKISEEQSLPGITEHGISERFPLEGYRSLYGASKLSSELLIAEYGHFYKLNTVVNRCGVLTGPWQMGKVDQGVVVLWLASHLWKRQLSYIGYGGTGKQVRDVLHVEDLFRLVDIQVHDIKKFNGKVLNVGGGNDVSFSLKELTSFCEQITGNKLMINQNYENRSADIRIYITDYRLLKQLAGWTPQVDRLSILKDTYQWLLNNEAQLKKIIA